MPNVSEGRCTATLEALAAAASLPGVHLADVSSDHDHHRSVLTLLGTADALEPALLALHEVAHDSVALDAHDGVHPRVGIVDVMPIVPLAGIHPSGAGPREAAQLAGRLRDALAGAGHAALDYGSGVPGRERSGLARAEARRLHPDEPVTLVGTRPVLVAFNVELNDVRIEVARSIAAAIRETAGGLPGVRALGFALHGRGTVQVSTNVERWEQAGPRDVLAAVVEAAAGHGSSVRSCELVGLAPAAAVDALGATGIPLESCSEPRLEAHVEQAIRTTRME